MKKITFILLLCLCTLACTESGDQKNKTVDTTIVGSDNPHPAPDTTGMRNDSTE